MLSLRELRAIDPSLSKLTNVELREVRLKLYTLAELALDSYAGSKNPVGIVRDGDQNHIIRV